MSTSKPSKKLTAPSDANRSKNASFTRGSKIGSRNPTFASIHSNIISSVSKKHAAGGTERSSMMKQVVQILDEFGNDVTPLPLLHVDPSLMKKNQANVLADGSVGTPTDLMSQTTASVYGATQVGTTGTSIFGGGPFTRSVFTQSYDTASDSLPLDEFGPAEVTTFSEVRHKRQEIQEVPTEADLDKIVDITLTETDTIWMFDLPDTKVSTESAEAEKVISGIRAYTELQKSRVGNDLYAERGMNTFNEPLKLKSVHTQKIETQEVAAECTNWDMYDTFKVFEKEETEEDDDEDEEGTISRPTSPKEEEAETVDNVPSAISAKRESAVHAVSRGGSAFQQCSSSTIVGSEIQSSLDTAIELSEKDKLAQEWEELSKSEQLKNHLFLLERVICLNTFQNKQAQYRGFKPVLTSVGDPSITQNLDMSPNLERLWSYDCPLTRGKNVSCIAWNKSNLDLLAVGYGQFEFTNQKPGLVCCWCIKNPKYPERVFTSKQGVTAVDFSASNPNLLAVGYYDGGIAIYNVRKSVDEPVLDNFATPGKHSGPVWQLRWVEKERGSGEERVHVLISISSDGRVCQWSIRKGLESYDVMKLKKMPTRMAGKTREKKGEAFVSRFAGGMCFDFHIKDSNIYLAGTEEGYIHKCSCSHNEQYLESYQGHTGPVYSIQWSPFVSDIFLSCSADWTMKLWHQDKTRPILSFHSSTKAVNDICWSPWSSTVFACVNEGAVEVWNLASSTLDAVYCLSSMSGAKQTSVSFSQNAQCLLVGDSEGQVTVYELRNVPAIPKEKQEQNLRDVIKASLASQLPGYL
ncbi:unnamed protein product [Candidula unifasciata]|uniref:Dynein axonemal intermediate chain 4 n=1 Tax=Candidula unifasciata TaxID=100452 RepID=A0A8S3YSG7_9EUPU|nr:unnamed protein product [Candidula unifasciata]